MQLASKNGWVVPGVVCHQPMGGAIDAGVRYLTFEWVDLLLVGCDFINTFTAETKTMMSGV